MAHLAWRVLFVVLLGLALVTAAAAQQAPPTWKQGQPAEMAASPLSPHAQPPAPLPAEKIPADTIKVPAGFKVELWASGLSNARAMTLGSKGTLFVSSRVVGNVYALVDKAGKREVKTIAKGLELPNGVAFRDGALYVAAQNRILKYEGIEDRLDSPGEPAVVIDSLPKHGPHGWKYLAFGPDGKLYFNIGAPCNICLPPETNANISRINPDGTGFEYVARGVRNSVGFDWHPATKELYFANHGRDWLGEDVPNDTLHQVSSRSVPHFGYPFCHQGDILDPEFGRGRACSEFNPPLLKLGPHVAPIGMAFYVGSMFPPEYQNRIFIAERGSWNRKEKVGFRVVMVTLMTGQPPKHEVFAEGWLQGDQFWGRPVYPYVMPDGALLVSDDYAGAIYRITYQR
ncbi:MAG TPA: PQQ-dependent sugar dehydrogenase [Methylomirabilota bacterium]|jgi:glucose/arabinose dehydrogenase|nr:PQQ-dependent sugar dehydrogenase [Methylomirabilota bacterium]